MNGREALALEAILPMIGDGARALVARALAASRGNSTLETREVSDDATFAAALASFERAYSDRPCVHTRLLEGAEDALALDLPVALVTNKPRALTLLVLDGLGIRGRFGAIYAGGDGPLKPAPDGVLAATRALGVAPAAAWFVGDGPQDVLAARAAGAVAIAVYGIAARALVEAAAPDAVVASLAEVADLARASLTSA